MNKLPYYSLFFLLVSLIFIPFDISVIHAAEHEYTYWLEHKAWLRDKDFATTTSMQDCEPLCPENMWFVIPMTASNPTVDTYRWIISFDISDLPETDIIQSVELGFEGYLFTAPNPTGKYVSFRRVDHDGDVVNYTDDTNWTYINGEEWYTIGGDYSTDAKYYYIEDASETDVTYWVDVTTLFSWHDYTQIDIFVKYLVENLNGGAYYMQPIDSAGGGAENVRMRLKFTTESIDYPTPTPVPTSTPTATPAVTSSFRHSLDSMTQWFLIGLGVVFGVIIATSLKTPTRFIIAMIGILTVLLVSTTVIPGWIPVFGTLVGGCILILFLTKG